MIRKNPLVKARDRAIDQVWFSNNKKSKFVAMVCDGKIVVTSANLKTEIMNRPLTAEYIVELFEGVKDYQSESDWKHNKTRFIELIKEYGKKQCTMPDGSKFVSLCVDCGKELTLVRPGKHQCDNENCQSNIC